MTALTIGMATYDDFDGVYFTIQALRLYQDVSDTEFLVIDNYGCDSTRQFVKSIPEARYVLATELVGTAAPRDLVFRRATGRAVMCIDSHVMLVPSAVARLKAYYRDHPETSDLLQGPLLYDNMDLVSTHFRPEWNAQMWGVWDTDQRALEPEAEPFDIPMQGLGLFSCRRRAWPGFNPRFRGFGGEEGYIHEKFRQRGGRTLCLPWLRWIHRFSRPKGVPYPLAVEDKLRNYIVGHTELGLDVQPALDHFSEFLPPDIVSRVYDEAMEAMSASPKDRKAFRTKDRKRKPAAKRDAAAEPEPDTAFEAFDADMARALLDAIPDEVRIAFGREPLTVADFPPPGPERDAARTESRALVLAQGWLDEIDLATLDVEKAIATAVGRARNLLGAASAFDGAAAPDALTLDGVTEPRSPPGVVGSARQAEAHKSGRSRAIVCFVDDNRHLLQQAVALYLSWQRSAASDTDFVAMGPARVLARLPDDVVKIPQQPATADPVWRDYAYVNSIACMNAAGAELLDRYDYVLRTDVDTFVTPAWDRFRPEVFTYGIGGYSNSDDVRARIRNLAAEYGLRHRGLTNVGSTWYGPTAEIRRACAISELIVKRLLTHEFADDPGEWPGWYQGVILLYAGEIAVNHCAPRARQSTRLDFFSTSTDSIRQHPHIHCWHTDELFSKHRFMARLYTDEDWRDLDPEIVRDYCLDLSFRSLALLGEPIPRCAPASATVAAEGIVAP